jgi:hypothetical protein
MYRQGEVNPLPFVKVRANGRKEGLIHPPALYPP